VSNTATTDISTVGCVTDRPVARGVQRDAMPPIGAAKYQTQTG